MIHSGTHRSPLVRATCVAALAVLLGLSACAADPAPAPAASTPSSPPAASTSAPAAPPVPTPTSSFTLGPGGSCDPRQLSLSLEQRGMDSGMGHFYWNLVFTNSSNEPCSLDGIPSVVMAAASTGAPLGNAADPAAAPGAGSVPLAPGASAYSLLSFTAGGVYLCTAPVDALLVTAPNSDAVPAVVPAPNPIEGCDDTEHTLFTVGSLLAVPVTF